ncbi:DNA recombination protein RmuC [Citreimonas salinaria]|uniref:DNA recombination protein RmuC homolog n=1 Tax=Citreimonas salinaria TaxID=321339 RepID=A0A1H3EWM3_9RHOB|nr:DNA recombination protein RmuC [Citreimonas salinaria]SDX83151.1 DNA recombination protein RmuC [Citreimonas salinaria]
MDFLDALMAQAAAMDPLHWTWIALAGLTALLLVGRRNRPLHDRIATLETTLADRDAALRDALARADRAETLAEARAQRIEALEDDCDGLRDALEAARSDAARLDRDLARLNSESAATLRAADEKIALLTQMREEMATRFRDLSRETLRSQGEEIAKSNMERLKATLSPLHEHVGHFEKALKAMHESSQRERTELKLEITSLTRRTEQISAEAVALTRALRSDQQKQGAWGEMVLERILEDSGLREGAEYEVQAHRTSDGGRLRPDVVVNIPGGKTLVIDAKVSLTAYTDLVNAQDDDTAASAARRHMASLRGHIDTLASKSYHAAEDHSVDYTILFVPIEGAFSEALRLDGTLTTYALERHVTIATPTTLMMALKTVAHVWAAERRNRNAEAIADRAGKLYDKVSGFVDNMDEMGRRLGQAQDAYGRAFDQLSRGRGNVLGQIDQLRALGARTSKTLKADFDAEDGHDALTGQPSDEGPGASASVNPRRSPVGALDEQD